MVEFGSKSMFPTDPTDIWGNIHRVGNAELAARLGSIHTFDRRGDIVWMDDFESPVLKWATSTTGTGTGASIALSTNAARNGSQSVKLTTGNVIGDETNLYMNFQRPVMKRMALEFSTTFDDNTAYVACVFWVQHGGKKYTGTIYLYPSEAKVKYMPASGGSTLDLNPDFGFVVSPLVWYTLKLVIDTEIDEYARVLLDGTTYDMSGKGLRITTGGTVWYLGAQISHKTKANINASCYVDDVIITQNEP